MDSQMIGIIWLGGAFLLGLVNCFFGYRLFIITVAIVGFLLGGFLGYLGGSWIGSNTIGLVLMIVLGLIGAWASVSAYYAFIFVAAAFGFAFVTAFIMGLYKEDVSILFPLIGGLIGGFSAMWLQRFIIIVATAAQGALASIFAAVAVVNGGGVLEYQNLFYRFLDGDLARSGGLWFFVGAGAWLILFVLGLGIQFTRGKEMYKRVRKVAAEPAR